MLRHGLQTLTILKDLNRESPVYRSATNLNTVAADAAALCDATAARRQPPIAICIDLGSPPEVRVNAGEMLAAIVNLLTNSLDALAGSGGQITLRTGSCDDGVWIEVEDDGPGMSSDVQARAFEPFFTTKGDAGTGLGLSTVQALATRYEGRLELRSESGRGTTIRVVLPVAGARNVV